MEQHYQINTQLRNKYAMHMLKVNLPTDFIKTINDYVDNDLIPSDKSYSKGLVGQIRQNKRSAQLDCKIFETENGELLKSTLDSCSNEYLRQIGYVDNFADVFEAWTVHSFSGDYNPLHDHGVKTPAGLSMILYLQVPECIQKLPDPDDQQGMVQLNESSGQVDGFTYFVWGQTNKDMWRKLYPVAEEYFKPKAGTLLIFPNWLKHAVMPFYGDGERRTLAANANVISPEMYNWKDASEEDRKKLLQTLRGDNISIQWRKDG